MRCGPVRLMYGKRVGGGGTWKRSSGGHRRYSTTRTGKVLAKWKNITSSICNGGGCSQLETKLSPFDIQQQEQSSGCQTAFYSPTQSIKRASCSCRGNNGDALFDIDQMRLFIYWLAFPPVLQPIVAQMFHLYWVVWRFKWANMVTERTSSILLASDWQ